MRAICLGTDLHVLWIFGSSHCLSAHSRDRGGVAPGMSSAVDWLGGSGIALGPRICRHASRILRLGEYWGFSDWIAYGWSRKTQIIIHLGDGHVRLFKAFTPAVIYATTTAWPELHVIGVRYGGAGSEVAWDWRQVNHFIYSRPSADLDGESMSVEDLSSTSACHVNLSDATNYLLGHYQSLGFTIAFTAANGCCGPDTAAIHEGRPSLPTTWKSIRLLVHQSHLKLRGEWWYADCFKACQEQRDDSGDEEEDAFMGEDFMAAMVELVDSDVEEGGPADVEEIGEVEEIGQPLVPSAAQPVPLDGVVEKPPPGVGQALERRPVDDIVDSCQTWAALTKCAQERRLLKRKSPGDDAPKPPPRGLKKITTELGKRLKIGQSLLKFEEGMASWF